MGSNDMPELGSKISLISKADIRYEGKLFTVDPQDCTIALANVRSLGTEDRVTDTPVPAQNQVYDYILFRATDIKDISVIPNPPVLFDPAIVQLSAPPSIAPGSGSRFGSNSGTFSHPVLGQLVGGSGGDRPSATPASGGFNPMQSGLNPPQLQHFSSSSTRNVGDYTKYSEMLDNPRNKNSAPGSRSIKVSDQGTQASHMHHSSASPPPVMDGSQGRNDHGINNRSVSSRSALGSGIGGGQAGMGGRGNQRPDHQGGVGGGRQNHDFNRRPQSNMNNQGPIGQRQHQNQQHPGAGYIGRSGDQRLGGGNNQRYNQQDNRYQNQGNRGGWINSGMRNQGGGRMTGGGGGGIGGGGGGGGRNNSGGGGGPPSRGPRPLFNMRAKLSLPPKQPLKFDSDYDFDKANNEFEELRQTLISQLKINENNAVQVQQPVAGEGQPAAPQQDDKKDDSGNETAVGDCDDDGQVAYDKSKSFFDNISCEALEKSKGRSQRTDWRKELKLNSETFGVAVSNRRYYYNQRNGGRGGGGYYRGGGNQQWSQYKARQQNNMQMAKA